MPKKTKESTKIVPTLRTIVQANGREIDVTNIAADALKAYKSVRHTYNSQMNRNSRQTILN